MPREGELVQLFLGYPFAFFVILIHQASVDVKARRIPGRSDVVENGLIRIQGNTSPIRADVRKQLMFDRIPLGCTRRIMADRHGELVGITNLVLQVILPGPRAGVIGSAAVGEDQELILA